MSSARLGLAFAFELIRPQQIGLSTMDPPAQIGADLLAEEIWAHEMDLFYSEPMPIQDNF